jgi:hypothetical protein
MHHTEQFQDLDKSIEMKKSNGRTSRNIGVEMSAEPRPFDCECIVDSGFGRLITKEK